MDERKVIVLEHLSLDGVIQGPGGPEEDTSDGFSHGGWTGPFSDPILNAYFKERMNQDFDLLLGRRTYDIWASYWPAHKEIWPQANSATKYIASRTVKKGEWARSVFLQGDLADGVRGIKSRPGPDLHVWGSSQVVQELLRHDLIDELRLVIYPVVIGSGKRLFAESAIPLAFEVAESATTPRGVLVLRYRRSPPSSRR